MKTMEIQLMDLQGKLDETNRSLGDFDAAKKRLTVENGDLLRQLEEAEAQVSQLTKLKTSLMQQLDEAKRTADEESRVCIMQFILKTLLKLIKFSLYIDINIYIYAWDS